MVVTIYIMLKHGGGCCCDLYGSILWCGAAVTTTVARLTVWFTVESHCTLQRKTTEKIVLEKTQRTVFDSL